MASPYGERIARLETMVKQQMQDTSEIKADVKTLLASKWKAEGKRLGWSAAVALFISLVIPFLKG